MVFRTCRGQTRWKIDRTLQEDWDIENTEISYPAISRQATGTWRDLRPCFFCSKIWSEIMMILKKIIKFYLYQDLQLRVTVPAQLVLVESEADSCLSFIQQPFGPLSQAAKLLHPAVSRQRALPKWYLPRYFPRNVPTKNSEHKCNDWKMSRRTWRLKTLAGWIVSTTKNENNKMSESTSQLQPSMVV